jgi:hypothetical protein
MKKKIEELTRDYEEVAKKYEEKLSKTFIVVFVGFSSCVLLV